MKQVFCKFEVYIPESHVTLLIDALNEKQLLREGNYDSAYCSYPVTGHWRPLEGANPYDGEIGTLKTSHEIKIEFRTSEMNAEIAYDIIRAIHPYEVPVINRMMMF